MAMRTILDLRRRRDEVPASDRTGSRPKDDFDFDASLNTLRDAAQPLLAGLRDNLMEPTGAAGMAPPANANRPGSAPAATPVPTGRWHRRCRQAYTVLRGPLLGVAFGWLGAQGLPHLFNTLSGAGGAAAAPIPVAAPAPAPAPAIIATPLAAIPPAAAGAPTPALAVAPAGSGAPDAAPAAPHESVLVGCVRGATTSALSVAVPMLELAATGVLSSVSAIVVGTAAAVGCGIGAVSNTAADTVKAIL